MRSPSIIPAVQLKSSAGRYRSLGPQGWHRSGGWRLDWNTQFTPAATRELLDVWSSDNWVRDERMARVEAVLFVAKQPIHARKVALYANLADGTEARTLMLGLNQIYQQTGCAFRVIEVAGGWQLRSRPQFASWLRRLPQTPAEVRLSPPSLETLAVIAYRQPVTRADVESIRGVSCGEIIRQLIERDLVTVAGRSEELGRPYFYATTKRFLEVFGLQSIEGLPRFAQMKQLIEPTCQPGLKQAVEPDRFQVSVHESSERGDVAVKATVSNDEDRKIPLVQAALESEQAACRNRSTTCAPLRV